MIRPDTFYGYPLDWVEVRWLAENLPDTIKYKRHRSLCSVLHESGVQTPLTAVLSSVSALGRRRIELPVTFPIAGVAEWNQSAMDGDFYRDTPAGLLRYAIIELWQYIIDNREAILNEQK